MNAGFSMIELLVSIGIVVLVLSIVVTNQNAFNSAVLLRGQAYEIALAMREIQLGTISAASDGGGEFRSIQGIYFNRTDGNNQQYRLFRDADGDLFPESNLSEDFGFSGIVDPRFEIRRIELDGGTESELAIVFQRPNFDAVFVRSTGVVTVARSAVITVGLRGGGSGVCGEDIREIEITAAGQIAVLECQP